MNYFSKGVYAVRVFAALGMATPASAQGCTGLPSHGQLTRALQDSISPNVSNGGFNLQMWATVVNRDGQVCRVSFSRVSISRVSFSRVSFSGGDRGDQWPGSRVISAQKANTANAFSLPGLALASGNLYAATQPGGYLYGLQHIWFSAQ